METPQAQDIHYNALIDHLIENYKPAKRLWPVNIRLALWLAFELSILASVALAAPRPDLQIKLQTVQYLVQIGIFIVIGTIAGALALRTGIPGREATHKELIMILIASVVAVLVTLREPVDMALAVGTFIRQGMRCVLCTGMLAALPWFGLFWAVRRGAPLMADRAGILIGAAAFSFAFAATRLGCPIDDSLHILVWHMMPAFLGVALSTLAGMLWLRRKSRIASCGHSALRSLTADVS